MNTHQLQAPKLTSHNRLTAAALAVVLTLGTLISVDQLASNEAPAALMAQKASAHA